LPLYSWKCKSCGGSYDLPRRELVNDDVCGHCGGELRRDYSTVQMGGPSAFQPHFNTAVGQHVNNKLEFETALKRGAERAGSEYVPLYPGDSPRPTKDDHIFETQARTLRDRGIKTGPKTTVIPLGD
jgi:hypothetical protein